MDVPVLPDQQRLVYIRSVLTLDAAQRIYQERWMGRESQGTPSYQRDLRMVIYYNLFIYFSYLNAMVKVLKFNFSLILC